MCCCGTVLVYLFHAKTEVFFPICALRIVILGKDEVLCFCFFPLDDGLIGFRGRRARHERINACSPTCIQ